MGKVGFKQSLRKSKKAEEVAEMLERWDCFGHWINPSCWADGVRAEIKGPLMQIADMFCLPCMEEGWIVQCSKLKLGANISTQSRF